jgi:hypothetical protein
VLRRTPLRLLALLFIASACAVWIAADDSDVVRSAPVVRLRGPQPTYVVRAGLDGEVFPVFANYASLKALRDRKWGTITLTISNPTSFPLRNRIAVELPGWSDQEIQMVELRVGESRTFVFAPSFLPHFYRNREITAATALVTAEDMAGRTVFSTTIPVRLRAAGDMYWGSGFRYGSFIASWVTPHDEQVEGILSSAKEYAPERRLPGYERDKTPAQQSASTKAQVRAIFRALQEKGISYVKSSLTFGNRSDVSERVRLPRESLEHMSANCIDGVVMYASLLENLGLDPVVVIVPGHAYIGVRLAPGSDEFLYLETALTARGSFEKAVKAAERALSRFEVDQIRRFAITEARRAGIYPMPSGVTGQPADLEAATHLK